MKGKECEEPTVSEDRFVADFVSLETAALQLDVSENTLRQWIKKGLARASRRGGSFVLRTAEIERLRKAGLRENSQTEVVAAVPLGDSDESPAAPELKLSAERPRVLPPRSREEENGSASDRRKKLGRRGTDFSLESLHSEVRLAVEEALDSLDPRFLTWQRRIEDLIHQQRESLENLQVGLSSVEARPAQTVPDKSLEILERRSRELESELEQSRHNSSEVRRQLSSLQDNYGESKRQIEQLKEQVEDLESERDGLKSSLNDAVAQQKRLQQELDERKQTGQSESGEISRLNSRCDQLQEEIVGERSRSEKLQLENENLENENLSLRAKIVDLESDKSLIHRSRVDEIERLASEKQAGLDQINRLQLELDRLNEELDSIRRQEDSLNKKLQTEVQTRTDQSAQVVALEAKLAELQKQYDDSVAEGRKLKDQVNNLQFKMQMQVPGSSLSATEENRKLLEKIADMEVAMREKDRIVSQGYSQVSEGRSKLEEMERSLYELQQRYDREKEEWSQIVAQQLRVATEQQQQRQGPKSVPPPSSSVASKWGLFRPRGDGLG